MFCAPLTASCLNQKTIKVDNGSLEISFNVVLDEHRKPKNMLLKTNSHVPETVKRCLIEKWSSLEMPVYSTPATVNFTIDFKSISK